MRVSYSTLWGYGENKATPGYSPFRSDEDAKKFRDEIYRRLVKAGVKVRRSSLKNQTRKYWDMGNPCNKSCTVYELEYDWPLKES